MLVLFDIDGTLLHAAGVGRAAIEQAMLAVYGTAGPIDDLPFDGLTDPQIARTLLDAEGFGEDEVDRAFDALWLEYLRCLESEIEARHTSIRPAPGVPGVLDALEEVGAFLGLVTGNIAAGARGKLSACGLWHRFPFGAFGCDSADRNALPPIALARAYKETGVRFGADETWIIGDTPQDIGCAHASGLRALAVATGRFSVEELDEAGADRTLDSLGDAERVLAILGGA